MDFFKKYRSNTLAGSGNQTYFVSDDPQKMYTSRTFYKVFCGGGYNYSFLFSNIIDSTFADGSHSHKNMVLDSWQIEVSVGITDFCNENEFKEPAYMQHLTFDGKTVKTVNPGEFFCTDEVQLAPKSGEYICLEISFRGKMIPCHEESIIPSFLWEDGIWIPSKRHPFAAMIGCDRKVRGRIGFLGDSITQGIGTKVNSYKHWNSLIAENIGTDFAYWNLGLGYGRADDAASDGAWLYKAKQNDIIFVCYGVNDIMQGFDEDKIKQNLDIIIDKLYLAGKKVIMQTIPPFDYEGDKIVTWNHVNDYIRRELSEKADYVFDCTKVLQKSEKEPHMAKYGGHPNEAGCKVWAESLSMMMY